MMLGTQSEATKRRILLICWQAWNLRNDVIHDSGKETVTGSVRLLVRYETEFLEAQTVTQTEAGGKAEKDRAGHSFGASPKHWSPPAPGWAKLNSDAAFLADTGDSWGGVVARDPQGLVFFSVCQHLKKCSSVEEAEAGAILCGLKELAKRYNGRIILETDNASVGRELKSTTVGISKCYPILTDIRQTLELFADYQISVVGRKLNKLAHELAFLARTEGNQALAGSVPENLKDMFLAECNPTH